MANIHTLSNGDLFFTEISPTRTYKPNQGETRTRVHWGDLKLMMADISFLTFFWDPETVPKPIVVAAGAAPGLHYPLLADLFPDFTFHLYDPSKFGIKGSDRIHIHQEFFTDDVARQWAGRNDVFFTSDIRRVDFNKVKGKKLEAEIEKDMRAQERWVEIIDPVFASLKFRLPYVDADAAGNFTDVPFDYLDGYVMRQQWQPLSTNETRLITVKIPEEESVGGSSSRTVAGQRLAKRTWSSLKHQDQCYWFNTIEREGFTYRSPFVDGVVDTSAELKTDYDSTATAVILKLYIEKMAGRPALQNEVASLFQLITDSINQYKGNYKLTLEMLRASKTRTSKRIFKDG